MIADPGSWILDPELRDHDPGLGIHELQICRCNAITTSLVKFKISGNG